MEGEIAYQKHLLTDLAGYLELEKQLEHLKTAGDSERSTDILEMASRMVEGMRALRKQYSASEIAAARQHLLPQPTASVESHQAIISAVKGQRARKDCTFDIPKNSHFGVWYEQICLVAEIIDKSYPVKGMPVFIPYGFYLHNKIMQILEEEWDKQDIAKVQFPLLIPQSFLSKEEDHIKGFDQEVFWVTRGGKKTLQQALALRPTSETAMYSMFSKWCRSKYDLPIKVHQTCSVYRYETKDTRPLIRAREIHWNEVHTAHATAGEAKDNLERAWQSYKYVLEDVCGVFGLRLWRPAWDKFAGAEYTQVLDVILPDGKVLQTVGAHYLGQRFSKPFEVRFETQPGEKEWAYMTCYGISTRVLASVLSLHGDDRGLRLPSPLARWQIVLVPIMRGDQEAILEHGERLRDLLSDAGLRVKLDGSEVSFGKKCYYWEMKGVPLRIEFGPRDIERGQYIVFRRDDNTKTAVKAETIVESVQEAITFYNHSLRAESQSHFQARVVTCATLRQVWEVIESGGGCARFPYHSMEMDGQAGDEILHAICGAEIRGWAPEDEPPPSGTMCLITGKSATVYAYAAKAY
jgi:prolyl-tRNA synthetase